MYQLSSGQRKRGRPRLRFKDTIKRNLKLWNIKTDSWTSLAQQWAKWRIVVKLMETDFVASRQTAWWWHIILIFSFFIFIFDLMSMIDKWFVVRLFFLPSTFSWYSLLWKILWKSGCLTKTCEVNGFFFMIVCKGAGKWGHNLTHSLWKNWLKQGTRMTPASSLSCLQQCSWRLRLLCCFTTYHWTSTPRWPTYVGNVGVTVQSKNYYTFAGNNWCTTNAIPGQGRMWCKLTALTTTDWITHDSNIW